MTPDTDKPTRKRWHWRGLLLAVLAVAYFGGYIALSEFVPASQSIDGNANRELHYRWMMTAYGPLRSIESAIRGTPVNFWYTEVWRADTGERKSIKLRSPKQTSTLP